MTRGLRTIRRLTGEGRVAGHAAIYVLASAINAALPFLLLPFLTRWLGPADFGIVGIFAALVNMLVVVVGLSTHGLISVVFYRDGTDALPPQAGAAIGVALITTPLLLAITWLAGPWIAAQTGIPDAWLWTAVIAASGQFLVSIGLTVFQTRQQPFNYAMLQIGYGAGIAALTILLVAGATMEWRGRLLAQMIAAIATGLIAILWLTKTRGIRWSPAGWPVRAALGFGLPLIPHAFGAVAMSTADRFALGSIVGPVSVGHYFFAAQIGSVFVVLAAAVNQAWLPWLYERLARGSDDDRRDVVVATYGVVALLALGGSCVSILAPLIVPLVAGPGFEPAIPILQLLGPAYACSAMYFFVAGYVFYEKRTGLLSVVTVLVATVQVCLSVAMAHWAGAIGVALATLVSGILYPMATLVAAQRVHPMPWLRALRWQRS